MAAAQWIIVRDFDVSWKCWGEEAVIYHSGSGDTHVVNTFSLQMLEILQHSPIALSDLTEALLPLVEDDSTDKKQLQENIQRFLKYFLAIGLIESI